DANMLLKKIVNEKWFTANGVIGFWPASSNNRDTITLQTQDGEVKLESLRQQLKKAIGQPSYSLADFICPAEKGEDFMGAFAVCIDGAKQHVEKFAAEHD